MANEFYEKFAEQLQKEIEQKEDITFGVVEEHLFANFVVPGWPPDNEFSHSAGVFERSVLPIDVPEMKTTANFILRKIKGKDLISIRPYFQSIGVNEEPTETLQKTEDTLWKSSTHQTGI